MYQSSVEAIFDKVWDGLKFQDGRYFVHKDTAVLLIAVAIFYVGKAIFDLAHNIKSIQVRTIS